MTKRSILSHSLDELCLQTIFARTAKIKGIRVSCFI